VRCRRGLTRRCGAGQALDERRHLLRLWVTPRPERLPPRARAAFRSAVQAAQNTGIRVRDAPLVVPLEAE